VVQIAYSTVPFVLLGQSMFAQRVSRRQGGQRAAGRDAVRVAIHSIGHTT
jgi:hypothetical protein